MLYTNNLERIRITSGGELKIPAGIGPQITFENQHGHTGDAAISTYDDGVGTLLCLGSNFYFSSAGAESRYNTSEESAGIVINRTGNIDFNTNDTSATATTRLRITSGGQVNIGGDYTQTSRKLKVTTTGSSQLEVQGQEADIWMTSTGPGNTQWRILGSTGTTTHRFRVYDETNNRDCIQVHNDGSVATPAQPRFFARRSANYTGYDGRNVGGTWIAFDVLDYNVGGGFQTSGSDQGRFVAPVSGLYLFHAATYKGTTTVNWSQSWFDVDGSRANGTDFVHSSGTRFAQNAIQVYMTAGQKIGFHPYNNQTNNEIRSTATHTWFKGCLLG